MNEAEILDLIRDVMFEASCEKKIAEARRHEYPHCRPGTHEMNMLDWCVKCGAAMKDLIFE